MSGTFLGRKPAAELEIQIVGRPLGVTRIAQERTSDFTGYTENLTFADLQDFLRSVGGPRWELSIVPISKIKCWNTSAPLEEILCTAESSEERSHLRQQVKRLATRVRQGIELPGIFLVRSQNRSNTHWILDGHRRLLAHRAAKASTIPVYHPLGMFRGDKIRK